MHGMTCPRFVIDHHCAKLVQANFLSKQSQVSHNYIQILPSHCTWRPYGWSLYNFHASSFLPDNFKNSQMLFINLFRLVPVMKNPIDWKKLIFWCNSYKMWDVVPSPASSNHMVQMSSHPTIFISVTNFCSVTV